MSADPVAAHVFAKLRAIWGTRFTSMWRGAEMSEVLSTWDDALVGVDRERIRRALAECQNSENPPTLPEFLRLCRAQPAAADCTRMVSYSGVPTEPARARANLERAVAGATERARLDPLGWARRPKSAAAVRLLTKGAATDSRLRAILLEHVDDGGTRCRSDEAVRTLRQLIESGAVDRIRASELQEAA